MISVDTNILVRAVLDDDLIQAAQARSLLKKAADSKQLFVSSYAILEMAWVLKVKGRLRQQICEAIFNLIDSPGVTVGQREVVIIAVEKYKKGNADLGDYFIMVESEMSGAHRLASFDQSLYRDASTCRPPAEVEKLLQM